MKKIVNKLSKENAEYYNKNKSKWMKITPFLEKIPCFPIKLGNNYYEYLESSYDLGYFFGLAIGSSYRSDEKFIVVIEPTQQVFMIDFLDRYNIKYSMEFQERRRKAYNKIFVNYYQKIMVKMPYSFKRFLRCLGLNIDYPRIARLPDKMKLGVIAGLFDSKKAQYRFNNNDLGIHEIVILRLTRSKLLSRTETRYFNKLISDIKDILADLGIKSSIISEGIFITGKSNLTLLFCHFNLNKVKAIALSSILDLRSIEAYYTTIINVYPLNEIDLTIWGYLLYNLGRIKRERVPYTCLEIVFKVGSQVIRQSLYKLSELGLIRYFARGHKEFISRSKQAIKKVEILLEKKYQQTRKSENELLLQCPQCLETIDYLSCFDDMDFRCPSCGELMQIITNKEKSSHELRKLTKFINSVLEEGHGKKIQRIMTSTIKTRE